jgi:hypothetical protein
VVLCNDCRDRCVIQAQRISARSGYAFDYCLNDFIRCLRLTEDRWHPNAFRLPPG